MILTSGPAVVHVVKALVERFDREALGVEALNNRDLEYASKKKKN
jgi:hypothetical protein